MRKESSDEGSRWLMQAIADRDGAEILFEGGSFHLACFIAQQVAEKHRQKERPHGPDLRIQCTTEFRRRGLPIPNW